MKTLKDLTQAKVEFGRKANPEFMKGVDHEIEKAKAIQQGSHALAVGEKAPNFELPNHNGAAITLNELLSKGPLVITFYRGSWCPYCNLQLNALQSRLSEIESLGAQLVAISPQKPDNSLTSGEMNQIKFTVLSDQDAKVAEKYGVAWKVPTFLLEHMRNDRKLDLEEINNGNATILPIPATFVLNKNGIVTWRFIDVDYRNRSEPEDIINALKSI